MISISSLTLSICSSDNLGILSGSKRSFAVTLLNTGSISIFELIILVSRLGFSSTAGVSTAGVSTAGVSTAGVSTAGVGFPSTILNLSEP